MKFTHYLITRFNIHEQAWKQTDKNNQPVCTDDWMEHRFKLFDRYCVPSVKAQIRQEFKWIVIFHHKTAQKWRDRISKYNFEPLFVGREWLKEVRQYLDEYCLTRWLITTRLDNDDAIAPNMIQMVQDAFERQHFIFLDFPNGYRLKDGILYEHKEYYNPFLSLVERIDVMPRSVLSIPHGIKLSQEHEVIPIYFQPIWVQVIHERNKVTDEIMGPPAIVNGWIKSYV